MADAADTSQAPKAGADTQEHPVSQLVKELRLLDDFTLMEVIFAKIKEAAYALQASEEREQRLRALAKGFRANGIAPVDYHNSTIEEYIARQIERIIDGGQTMKAERLKEIRERCEAATPGPWEADIIYVEGNPASGAYAQRIRQGKSPFTRSFDVGVCYSEDATFIAHAREDVPFLLAEIERLSSQAPRQPPTLQERSALIKQVKAAIEQGAHRGEHAERVVSLQFLRRVLAVLEAK